MSEELYYMDEIHRLKIINLFKVLSKLNAKANAAGWVPSSLNRTAVSFSQQRPGVKPELQIRLATLGTRFQIS